jgi:RimJ/RimL family protein N-acetyltransferase
VIVRRALPADAPAIAEIHVRSWQAAYRGLIPDEVLDGLSVADRQAMWDELIARAGAVFVAERDGQLSGFCAVTEPSRDDDVGPQVAEIGAIYVDPDAWRSGSGTALVEAALAGLRLGDWRAVTLWVLAENQPALHFYARFGFAPDGTEKFYEPSGAKGIRMVLPL